MAIANKCICFLGIFTLSMNVVFSQNRPQDKVFTGNIPEKKLIQLGWDQPTPQILKKNYQMMEATSPFDGITIGIQDTISGFVISDETVFVAKEIKREWLQKSLADYKSCNFTKFKHNFLRVNAVPGNLKWEDDKAWAVVVKNVAVMAWFAKTGGLEGICFDPESYFEKQYSWSSKSGLSFFEAQFLTRKRGQQFMAAMAAEYPGITIWGLFMFSYGRPSFQTDDLHETLKVDQYALYPAFLNGMLDNLPAGAKMVEGNEDAYYPKSDLNLQVLYNDSRVKAQAFVAPENLAKYKTQYSIGMGLYFDMYSNTPGSKYYIGPSENRTRMERFRDRVTAALDISDEYVWIWNEQYKWWDIPYSEDRFNEYVKDNRFKLCGQILPGINQAFEYSKNPHKYVSSLLKSTDNFENLAVNPGFESEAGKAKEIIDWYNKDCPSGYLICKQKDSNISFTIESGSGINNSKSAAKNGNGWAYLIQSIPVLSGETYAISADGYKTGGIMNLSIRWTDENNFLIDWYLSKVNAFTPVQDNAWSNATTIITVPEGLYKMHVLLCAEPDSDIDKFYFDNLKVVEVNDLLRRNYK